MTGFAFLKRLSVIGIMAGVAMLAFCAQVFLFIDSRSHSVSDTLYGIFPYWVPAFLLWAYIAEKTARRAG